jgi:DNA helicase-2/ATP-dependent DNA helicase PcrA
MTLLDSTGGAAGSHLDDLEGLLQVADLHPDATTFEDWLFHVLRREHTAGGVTLATIHKVKGREWDRVVVFGTTEGLMPHRLAKDQEEERRVFHVGITRGRHRVRVLADRDRPSRFLAELDGSAPREEPQPRSRSPRGEGAPTGRGSRAARGTNPNPSDAAGSRQSSKRETSGNDPRAAAAGDALRAWRLARARSDRVPAYVVLSDKHLEGIAERMPMTLVELRVCPGIGPARLDRYGDDILEVLAALDTN